MNWSEAVISHNLIQTGRQLTYKSASLPKVSRKIASLIARLAGLVSVGVGGARAGRHASVSVSKILAPKAVCVQLRINKVTYKIINTSAIIQITHRLQNGI